MQDCKDIPAVESMLATAQKVLGYDILKLCVEGPKEKLDDTIYSQPALYIAGAPSLNWRGEMGEPR
jgi:[acyl-carrier-protein] S-malonyltransferase